MKASYWTKGAIGQATRYQLYALAQPDLYPDLYRERAWFIDRCKYDIDRRYGKPYALYGSGMDASGCAARFGGYKTLAEAKAAAVKLADLNGMPVERFETGNRTLIVGDKVTTSNNPDVFCSKRKVGVIQSLTSGGNCTVLWEGYDAPSEYRASLLMLYSEWEAQVQAVRQKRMAA